ncbi:MAG: hypothetical protein II896_06040 [Clostridia bacterium]|nr:hypothetical protein [Clostridia bacterium]
MMVIECAAEMEIPIAHPDVAAYQCAMTDEGVVVAVVLRPVYGRNERQRVLREVAQSVRQYLSLGLADGFGRAAVSVKDRRKKVILDEERDSSLRSNADNAPSEHCAVDGAERLPVYVCADVHIYQEILHKHTIDIDEIKGRTSCFCLE